MLSPEILWALVTYTVVMTITPGPNNLLLLSSGLTFGLTRTSWHMVGILCGVLLQICVTGAGLGALFVRFPEFQTGLKLAGTLYMLWLARRLWEAGEIKTVRAVRPISFIEAMGFQFVNPKAWIMATTVIAVFVPAGPAYIERLATVGLIFTTIALPCIIVWAASGAWLRSVVYNGVVRRRINRSMAVLSALTAISFWL